MGRVLLGILGVLIAAVGIIGGVLGFYVGGLGDDPVSQKIFGIAGGVLAVLGLYLLYRSFRRRQQVA